MDVISGKADYKLYEGDFYLKKGEIKRAIKLYKDGLRYDPEHLILLYEAGLAYSKINNRKIALKYWKKVAKIAPKSYLGAEIEKECNGISHTPHWLGYLKKQLGKLKWTISSE